MNFKFYLESNFKGNFIMLFIIADSRPSGFLIDAETFVLEARNKWPEESLEVIQSSDSLMSDVSIYI